MVKLKEILNAWKTVYSNFEYILLALVIALVFYEVNVIIPSYKSFFESISSLGLISTLENLLSISLGFRYLVTIYSYISLLIISLLVGFLFSLIMYKTTLLKSSMSQKTGAITSIGIFLGVIAPGCAACGIGILSLLGVSAAFFTFLPFEGLELSVLSMALLIYAIAKISQNINSCKFK